MLRCQVTRRRSTRRAVLLIHLRRPVRWHASLVRCGLGPLWWRLIHGWTTSWVVHGGWWGHVGLHVVVLGAVGVVLGWLGVGVAWVDAGEFGAGDEPLWFLMMVSWSILYRVVKADIALVVCETRSSQGVVNTRTAVA